MSPISTSRGPSILKVGTFLPEDVAEIQVGKWGENIYLINRCFSHFLPLVSQ